MAKIKKILDFLTFEQVHVGYSSLIASGCNTWHYEYVLYQLHQCQVQLIAVVSA